MERTLVIKNKTRGASARVLRRADMSLRKALSIARDRRPKTKMQLFAAGVWSKLRFSNSKGFPVPPVSFLAKHSG